MAKKKKKRYHLGPVKRYLTTIASYVKGDDNLIVFKSDFLKEMDNKSFVRWSMEGECYAARFSNAGIIRNARFSFPNKGSEGLPAVVAKYVRDKGEYGVAVAEFNDGDELGTVKAIVFADGSCTYLEFSGSKIAKEEVYQTPAVKPVLSSAEADVEAVDQQLEEEEIVEEEIIEEDVVAEEALEEDKKG